MGFGSVAAQLIMFIALMGVTTGLVIAFDRHTEETATAMAIKTDALAEQLKTDFVITNLNYNSTLNQTVADLLNTGSIELSINKTDIIIDGVFIPRDSNKNNTVLESTFVRNTLSWDPGEVLEIMVNKSMSANQTHTVDIITDNGIRKTDTFSWG